MSLASWLRGEPSQRELDARPDILKQLDRTKYFIGGYEVSLKTKLAQERAEQKAIDNQNSCCCRKK
jgi:hypothetical protein